MVDWQRWRETVADQTQLREWRRDGALDAAATAAAREALGPAPDTALWRWFLDRLALWLGVALCAAGVICFIAANWEHIGKFSRLYGMQALLVAAVVAGARLGLARRGGQAALWLAMVLLGGLLALIGQTYQTGADTWELFALWAALALPWAFAGRHAALWLLWVAVANIALGLWADTVGSDWMNDERSLTLVGLFDVAMYCLWSIASMRWAEFAGHAGPRFLAAVALLCLSPPAILAALDHVAPEFRYELCAWLAAIAVLTLFELRRQRDRAVFAMLLVAAIGVSTVWLYRLAKYVVFEGRDEPAWLWLVLALLVVGEATAGALWLRRMDRRSMDQRMDHPEARA
ncbi:MAG: DUF2157 domain-containing protein [Xanthomonadales bacterium]|nr:DUF2157 domain-containing protein [Xanthomonadales bacterium]